MSAFSDLKSESTVRLEIGEPFGVGMNTTEGERVLKALRRIQHRLNTHKSSSDLKMCDKKTIKTMNSSVSASGDHYVSNKSNKCTNTSIVENNYNKYNNQLIETRLQLIERQLQNILELMASNNGINHNTNTNVFNPYLTPSPSAISGNEEQVVLNQNHKYVDSFVAINKSSDKTKSNEITITKSKSFDAINKTNPSKHSKHYHLQYKDIPFLLGTVSHDIETAFYLIFCYISSLSINVFNLVLKKSFSDSQQTNRNIET